MKKILAVPGLLLSVIFHSAAQKTLSAPNVLPTQFTQEKIYIHYDKEYYVAGETIWFKAYLYSDGKPSNISSNLYIQFADSKGQIIASKKYPAPGAVAKGEIDIPDSLPQGNYYIRALTPGMMSADEAFIYKKNILIFKPTETNTTSAVQGRNLSLKFYPESGSLVDGILTVVAFKAADQWGAPIEVNGIIRTHDGVTITSFKSYHDGIGKVQFKPQAGKKYMAEVETDAGPRLYPLPEVQSSGINLKVQDEKGGKKFQLSRSEKNMGQMDSLLLVAEINNHVIYETEIVFEGYSSIVGHLVTDSLPTGILHFTVFNKDRVPIAERISFVDNREYRSEAAVVITKRGREKRAENILELHFPDAIQRNCSVAVTDISENSVNDNDNIWSRFLLTSELKGYIHNPAWYFEKQTDTTKLALDNLMLTHGWSRFNRIINATDKDAVNKNPYLISFSGIVYSDADKKPVKSGKLNVLFSTEDSSLFSYDIPVNESGQFLIDSLIIYGKTKMFYTYTDKRGKEILVTVKTDDNDWRYTSTKRTPDTLQGYIVNPSAGSKKQEVLHQYESVLSGNQDTKMLEAVTVTAKQKRATDVINEKYTSEIFRNGGQIKIDNINGPPVDKSMNGLDFVLNRIPTIGVQYGTFVNRKNFSLQDNKEKKYTITGPKTTISGPMRFWEVGLFINEVPADLVQLQSLRADQIAMVKLFEAGAIGAGSVYPGGALVVYLNYGTSIARKEKVTPKYIEYNGYSISKEFYSPDYSIPGINSNMTDNRTTLYWNPEIFTQNQPGTAQLKFFNNDFSKKIRIVVEGFDAMGRLIHTEKIIGD